MEDIMHFEMHGGAGAGVVSPTSVGGDGEQHSVVAGRSKRDSPLANSTDSMSDEVLSILTAEESPRSSSGSVSPASESSGAEGDAAKAGDVTSPSLAGRRHSRRAAPQLPSSCDETGRPSRGQGAASAADKAANKCKWGNSCLQCTRAKRKCDGQRPCGRCDRLGKGDACCDKAPRRNPPGRKGSSGSSPSATRRSREASEDDIMGEAPSGSGFVAGTGARAPKRSRAAIRDVDDAAEDFAAAASVLVRSGAGRTAPAASYSRGGVGARAGGYGADAEGPGAGVLRLLRELSVIPSSLRAVWNEIPHITRLANQHIRDLVTHHAFMDAAHHGDEFSADDYERTSAVVEASLQQSPIGTVRIYFSEDGHPCRLYMNNRCAQLFGANPVLLAQLLAIGKPVLYVHPEDMPSRMLKSLQAHATRKRNWTYEGRYRHNEGKRGRFSFFRATEFVAYEYYPTGKPRCVTASFVGVRPDVAGAGASNEFEMPLAEQLSPLSMGMRCDLENVGGSIDLVECVPGSSSSRLFFLDDPETCGHLLESGMNYASMEKEFLAKLAALKQAGVEIRAPPPEELRGVEMGNGVDPARLPPIDLASLPRHVWAAAAAAGFPTSGMGMGGAGGAGAGVAAHTAAPRALYKESGAGAGAGAAAATAGVSSPPVVRGPRFFADPLRTTSTQSDASTVDPMVSVGVASSEEPIQAAVVGGARCSTPTSCAAGVCSSSAPDDVDDLLNAVLAADAFCTQRPISLTSADSAALSEALPGVFRTFSMESTEGLMADF